MTYPRIGVSEPTWADEPKSSVPTFEWCRPLVPFPSRKGERTGTAGKTRGRQWQTTPVNFAKKTVMKKDNINEIVADGETPRPECDSTATGKERDGASNASWSNEVTGLKPKGSLVTDRIREQRLNLSCKKKLKLGTWNVRSMQWRSLIMTVARTQRVDGTR